MLRAPKTCPLTSFALSAIRPTASGAIFSGVIRFTTAKRARFSSLFAGIVPTIRVNARGAMQFERTLNFAMSIAIDLESAATPSFAAM